MCIKSESTVVRFGPVVLDVAMNRGWAGPGLSVLDRLVLVLRQVVVSQIKSLLLNLKYDN